ncbi:unnamed protein product [Prunus armeniaca]|uniref:Uncharacterized protein n=1 Tax=Prunus armeniaca TaxID=36596 RepID=A0A6J5VGV3_PRUAR|nr:unnamed protein product [Prunus armeniaca]CAB4318465.1 unnamed protein product [Prunus armeniaca]
MAIKKHLDFLEKNLSLCLESSLCVYPSEAPWRFLFGFAADILPILGARSDETLLSGIGHYILCWDSFNNCGKHRAMNDNGSSKLTGIRQIVKFKEILQKWQVVTLGSRANSPRASTRSDRGEGTPRRGEGASHIEEGTPRSDRNRGGISPAISKRLTNIICDSDEDNGHSPEPPADVPEGYLAVYVGPELRRFIIPTSYLSHSLFKVLLEKAEEEFGFDHSGGLTIPCETETFKYLLKCMENHQNAHPEESPAGNWKLIQ